MLNEVEQSFKKVKHFIKRYVKAVEAQALIRKGGVLMRLDRNVSYTYEIAGVEFTATVPVYVTEVVARAYGFSEDEAFAMAFPGAIGMRHIVVNAAMTEHPSYEDVLKHELAHLQLGHQATLEYGFVRSQRLLVEAEADAHAVRVMNADKNKLIQYLEEYTHKDPKVIPDRIARLAVL